MPRQPDIPTDKIERLLNAEPIPWFEDRIPKPSSWRSLLHVELERRIDPHNSLPPFFVGIEEFSTKGLILDDLFEAAIAVYLEIGYVAIYTSGPQDIQLFRSEEFEETPFHWWDPSRFEVEIYREYCMEIVRSAIIEQLMGGRCVVY